jgi:hypothetical protein
VVLLATVRPTEGGPVTPLRLPARKMKRIVPLGSLTAPAHRRQIMD